MEFACNLHCVCMSTMSVHTSIGWQQRQPEVKCAQNGKEKNLALIFIQLVFGKRHEAEAVGLMQAPKPQMSVDAVSV